MVTGRFGAAAGRFFRLEDCLDTLGRADLNAAADELLERLIAHTGRRLDDDVAVLLFEAAGPLCVSSAVLGWRHDELAPGGR